ncbi:polyprenyl glycosylphosphotransferase [Agromyces badenianii]|uniref:Polyprenyl glycosylphosphotransferase n=1 Tax=Agromyces badenianii TaxID=2080742 RepID=A0A2S0WYC2_9MICO|nr:sugar transferase [Agromyces badenianii]AWB96292.1 polyprenyl glycosylphosphotransferase [Agromyces badenianii]
MTSTRAIPSRRAPAQRGRAQWRSRELGDVEAPPRLRRVSEAAIEPTAWDRRFRTRLVITDAIVVVASVVVSLGAAIVFEPAATASPLAFGVIAAFTVATWLTFLAAAHTRDERVLGMGASEYRQVANSTALAFGLLALVFVITRVEFARSFVLVALPIGLLGILIDRWLWRKWLLRRRDRGDYLSRAIIAGSRREVEYVARQILERSGAGYHVVGAAIDAPGQSFIDAGGERVPIVAGLDEVAQSARDLGADAVILAGLTRDEDDYVRRLSWQLEGTRADLVLSSRLTDVAGPRIHFRPIDGLPLIQVEIPQFDGGKHALKRGFDIFASALGLLAIAPVLIGIALAIRLDGPGSILYTQERVGRDGKTFKLMKFRSMIPDADRVRAELLERNEASGLLFKLKDDPRVTRTGRFLRKHSLDELPQLWNVLRGDMSMVGPRPPLAEEVNGYAEHVHRRLLIKPGLTGLWQVSGRSDLDWDESVRLDLYYVENWSLTGDLMLIWRTVRVVVRPVGAY